MESSKHTLDSPVLGPRAPSQRSATSMPPSGMTSIYPLTEPIPHPPAQGRAIPTVSRAYYLNRELTWISFNRRVLQLAFDPRTPLLERLKFVAIVGSNLDEFFMKRIGGLKQQVGAGIRDLTVDGRTPQEQIDECYQQIRVLEQQLRSCAHTLTQALKQHGVVIAHYEDLSEAQQASLRDRFMQNIFPLVTPQAVGPAHPFPFISNLSLNLLVTLRYPDEEDTSLARVKVPMGNGVPRFLKVENPSRVPSSASAPSSSDPISAASRRPPADQGSLAEEGPLAKRMGEAPGRHVERDLQAQRGKRKAPSKESQKTKVHQEPSSEEAKWEAPEHGGTEAARCMYVPLEEVMAHNLSLLFPNMEVLDHAYFRVARNAHTEREEEGAEDLLELIELELRERRFAPIVRLEVSPHDQPSLCERLARALDLQHDADVFRVDGPLALRDYMEIASLDIPALRDPPHHPVEPPKLVDATSVLDTIRDAGSLLVHHPYESFAQSVERFLRESSEDPRVRAIKMTLYRTSPDSNIISCLTNAARNGKQVTVVVELKARFDEAANIRWANQLEEYGVHVTYGIVGLKTHAKVALVVRQDYDGLRRYAHIGTGNYHAGAARQYSDLGFFTCDPDVGHDLTELFNYLTTGFSPNRTYRKVLTGPKRLKKMLLQRIEREIKLHTKESPGHIQCKMNALDDADITRAFYRASQAGVRIDLLVRDTCRLRPAIPGLSENIRVVSIVGRFLEHARIYYFRNGGEEEYFVGSADCMRRNLMSRVEVLVPVEHPALRKELRFLLDTQMQDQYRAWDMLSDGRYVQRSGAERGSFERGGSERGGSDVEKGKGCHQRFIERAERKHRAATRLRRRKTQWVSE